MVLLRFDINFLRSDVLISTRFSTCNFGDLPGPAGRFLDARFSVKGVPKSSDTSSSTAFLFWLLVVICRRRWKKFSERINSSKKLFDVLASKGFNTYWLTKLTKKTCIYSMVPKCWIRLSKLKKISKFSLQTKMREIISLVSTLKHNRKCQHH